MNSSESGPDTPGGSGPNQGSLESEASERRPGRHRLHPLELIAMSWRTLRAEPGRVLVPAVVIFGVEAINGVFFTKIATDHLGLESAVGVFVFGASSLGLTFYSGMLERLVGSVERNEPPQPIHQVVRTLPWVRLLLAELLLVIIGGIAAAAALLPGLVVDTLFALVGPLINLLDCRVFEALRRSVRLVAPHFVLVFAMITIPLAIEHELLILIKEIFPHEKTFLIFLTSFLLGDVFGVAIGLVEVTLAERLVRGAHGPGEDLRSEDVEDVEDVQLPEGFAPA
jgi:hypothetical protein